jgi:hypothetical protein
MEKIYGREEGCCLELLSHRVSWVVSFVHYNPSFVADSVDWDWCTLMFRANDQQNFIFQDNREQGQSTRKVIWVGLEWHRKCKRTTWPESHALTRPLACVVNNPKHLRADCQSVSKLSGRAYERQQDNLLSKLLKCLQHHWKGNFLWPSIPNQKLKIIVLARLRQQIGRRSRYTDWTGDYNLNPESAISTSDSLHSIQSIWSLSHANFERRASPLGWKFRIEQFASGLVVDLMAVLSACK